MTTQATRPTWRKPDNIKTGDQVSYAEVSFWQERGTVTDVGPTERGGDITVIWHRTRITCEEVTRNLVVWY